MSSLIDRLALRWRIILAVAGLALVLLALVALAYVAWPVAYASETYRAAPTLFAPPPSP
jgi:Na+-transporting methylmalonyl-CoA/oxaloacetate decarboxylase gamma subunit